jgi:hypothetical protein
MANVRLLIATTPGARERLAVTLAGCPVDFVSAFREGVECLKRDAYSHVIVGYLFAESHMFDFAQEVHQRQPDARVLCVKASGRSLGATTRAGLNTAALQLGCEGFFDLTVADRPESFDRIFNDILARFPPRAGGSGEKADAVAAKLQATAQALRRIALG